MPKADLTAVPFALRRLFPEDGSEPNLTPDEAIDLEVHREELQVARLRVLGAILDYAATERSDSLTEIDEISDRLGEPLRPTNIEWREAENLYAPRLRALYPRGLGDDILGRWPPR